MATEILRTLVHSAMKLVTSADKAYHYLRNLGHTFTRAEVREMWKEVGREEYWSTVIETWGVDKPIPKQWRVESERLKSADFELVYLVRFMEVDTGEEFERKIGLLTNERLTFEEGWEEMEGLREKYEVLHNAVIMEWSPYAYVQARR